MPKVEKKYDILKAVRVNEEILDRVPQNKKFSTFVKELILERSGESDEIFKEAFQELYSIFEEFSKNPTLDKAAELFNSANLEIIDKAKEALVVE